MSLGELLAVVVLLGIFAAVASARFGQSAQKNFGAQGDARRLALDLVQCQRRAIASGANHYLEFTTSGGNVVGYTVYRRTGPSTGTAIDVYRDFSQGETVTCAQTQLEFTFDGAALAAYTVTLAGPNRTWQVLVVQATGAVRVQ
jgi:Tfp pilus assembly protein FimT